MNNTIYLADREEESFQRHCRLAKRLSKIGLCIFDVGANIGQSISQYRETFPDCSVTSFEPNPKAFSILSKDWASDPAITLNQIALTDFVGCTSFYATRISEVSSLLPPTDRMMELSSESKYDNKKIDVAAMTLDHYCQTTGINNIDILKVDVQGSELSVFRGATGMLQKEKISLIYCEVIFAETYKNQSRFADTISYLNKFNYEIWDIGSFLYTRNEKLWAANMTVVSRAAANFLEAKSSKK